MAGTRNIESGVFDSGEYTSEIVKIYYDTIKDHIESDIVDIYTIVAVMLKNYSETEGCGYQVFKACVCFLAQVLLPVCVIYDTILSLINSPSELTYCPQTSTWQDRVTGCVMTMYLSIYYLHVWAPFTYKLFRGHNEIPDEPTHRVAGILGMLLSRRLHIFMSEGMFVLGVIAKLLTHCLNTIACIFVIFQTTGSINIVLNACAIYFLNDVSSVMVDDHLKDRTIHYLKKRYHRVVNDSSHRNIHHNNEMGELSFTQIMTPQQYIDRTTGIIGLGLTLLLFPILFPVTLLATLGAIVYIPICHP